MHDPLDVSQPPCFTEDMNIKSKDKAPRPAAALAPRPVTAAERAAILAAYKPCLPLSY